MGYGNFYSASVEGIFFNRSDGASDVIYLL